jgi:glutamate carboxypeptidase
MQGTSECAGQEDQKMKPAIRNKPKHRSPDEAGVASFREAAAARQGDLLAMLEDLVNLESPSDDKAAVDRCSALVEQHCLGLGGRVRWHRRKQFGDLLEVRFGKVRRGVRPIMLLGHLDTVWPLGTLATMPFRIGDGRVWGPGVLDMKAGVAMALTAIRILQERDLLGRPLGLLLNSDEEVGSPSSRAVTEKLAAECEAVFVLEPAQGLEGAYKTARKGVGDFKVRVTGVAAHSGIDFARGHSAIAELARQIERIGTFTDVARGITVNAGVIGGGTRSNVVAAEAWAHVDVRIARASDAGKIERKFRSLRAFDKGCRIEVVGGMNRPPMERTAGTVALYKKAATLAAGLGFTLKEAATGGGSDGNFTSALGVPTLDGMGAVGDGAHARHESVVIEHLTPRTALLEAMLADQS